MNIWGKLLGGAAGFAIGGPIGALLGAVAGHAVDRLAESDQAPDDVAVPGVDDRAATRQIAFTIGIIVLGAKMAKADGVVSRSEILAFKQVFKIPPEEEQNVGRIFDQARRDAHGFEPYARQVARMFTRKSRVLEELIDGLFHIAKADGQVSDKELDFLRNVAAIFGFEEADFARIRESHLGADAGDPYNLLGVTRAMDNAAIKAAYRKLVRDTHPDKLMAKGLPPEFLAMANQRLATINAAYDRVCKERNIS
jgi:DnaJ like chaperone protein